MFYKLEIEQAQLKDLKLNEDFSLDLYIEHNGNYDVHKLCISDEIIGNNNSTFKIGFCFEKKLQIGLNNVELVYPRIKHGSIYSFYINSIGCGLTCFEKSKTVKYKLGKLLFRG